MKRRKALILAVAITLIVFSFVRGFRHIGFLSPENHMNNLVVSSVIDGDTAELSNGQMVRYIGIDTPELREKEGSVWVYKPRPYAEKALRLNRELVEGKPVRLEFDVQKRDRYNRLLAYVYAGDRMVNIEMVRHGYAMIYTFPPNVKHAEEFLAAQQEARKNKKGIWSDLERASIAPAEAGRYTGLIRSVEGKVIDTYISGKVLILNCGSKFKIVIFSNNFNLFPKEAIRSPDTFFRHKAIRVYGVIREYKGSNEIIVNDPSQLEVL